MIRVIGPRDKKDRAAINTTSHSRTEWTSQLSPFSLGPVKLYGNLTAQLFENAWQHTKVYAQHADHQGAPTAAYWAWARNGWNSNIPRRYPMSKGARPLYSLWDGNQLDYIDARKTIYLPLYRDLVKETDAFRRLERIYREQKAITLFDFDGYDHNALGLTLNQVLNNPRRICGHGFILAMMLQYGADFTIQDFEGEPMLTENGLYPITIVNLRTFKGSYQYIGRKMKDLSGSPLGNPFKVKPYGPHERNESVFNLYRRHLWASLKNTESEIFKELVRLLDLTKRGPVNLACWCSPEACHGEVIRNAIHYLAKIEIEAISANHKPG